ncbi:Pathoproteinsis-related protein 10.5 [Hibiscus syriacus]|uniref:Pathoproteinsis-related protein 10.5 n=1 Tax=Hibiscus syriacus TaxID=106335 RepID=A0A6A3CN97_HIBSY|nr:major strawberry allergen Fra a 1.04-like [Hibiscus syriacus]KAE8730945.1 Pathoproteinsis-related protein 10.5 [Hibiscus syriacus]
MFKACILDGDNLIPKVVPQAFKSVEYIQGNGDALMNKLEKITYETKLEASPDWGSVCKTTSKYYTIADFELKERESRPGKKRHWECSRPLKPISRQILMPTE